MVATAMAAQAHLQQLPRPRLPAASTVEKSQPFVTATAPTFFAQDTTNMIAAASAMPLPQPFPPQPQFLSTCATPPACIAAATAPFAAVKPNRGAGNGTVDACIAETADLLSQQHHLDGDTDAMLRLHHATLRAELERSARRHCADLVMALARQARSRIKAVDAELEAANRRKAEVEARVEQLAAESQAWLAVARDNEAAVAALRAGLEQAMVAFNQAPPAASAGAINDAEGFGVRRAAGAPADDAESCCFGVGHRCYVGNRGTASGWCRACRRRGDSTVGVSAASVVLLPCRHLCLCADCDRAGADACPVCGSAKTASIHVILP